MVYFQKITKLAIFVVLMVCGFISGKLSTNFREESSLAHGDGKTLTFSRRAPSFREPAFSSPPSQLNLNASAFVGGKPQTLDRIVAKLLKGDLPENWEQELKRILECPSTQEKKKETLLVFFSLWAETDFNKAMSVALRVGDYTIKKEIISCFTEKAPQEALRYYLNNKATIHEHHLFLIDSATQFWASQASEEALSWCLSSEADALSLFHRDIALSNIMREVGFKSSQTKEYLDKIFSQNGTIPNAIIRLWAADDPDSAQKWVETIGKDSSSARQALLTGIALNDPARAAKMLVSLPEEERSACISDILYRIPDKETAFSTLLEVKPLAEIEESDLSSIRSWTAEAPDKAAKWIQKLPASAAKDAAVEFYVQGLRARPQRNIEGVMGGIYKEWAYETAVRLISGMGNDEQKKDALAQLFQIWKSHDSSDFNHWQENQSVNTRSPELED